MAIYYQGDAKGELEGETYFSSGKSFFKFESPDNIFMIFYKEYLQISFGKNLMYSITLDEKNIKYVEIPNYDSLDDILYTSPIGNIDIKIELQNRDVFNIELKLE